MNAPFHIDFEREDRLGFPEIVFGESKPVDILHNILRNYQEKGKNALVTRLQPPKAEILLMDFPTAVYDPLSGVFLLQAVPKPVPAYDVAIIAGGTSDLPIVNEIDYVLTFLGISTGKMVDVGVSGLHRLLGRLEEIKKYKILIAVAGFEAALPTVLGGLVHQPIIAVPVSVGYGVAANGMTALNSMLASCANGIAVVNIDNGYGAALAAFRILNTLKKI
ncbi:MAG: nickel pincer cofactor biosynthesis protein LarB [Bacteroidia bacterium]|nr:nickel pincer cofactor biosynthesis protein LarB [Bacteroidia bacterium]